MSTNRINQTDIANKLGITRQAINKAIKEGRLKKHGIGRAAYIDLECPLTKAYMKHGTEQRHGGHTGKHKASKVKPQGKPKEPLPPPPDKKTPPDLPDNNESVNAFKDKQEIERLKKIQEIEKIELHNRRVRGELVERDIIQAFIHAMHEIDNGQWKTLGQKISSDIGAVFENDDDDKIRKAADVVEREVMAILKQIKREQNKFLKSIDAEKIPKAKKQL